MKLYSSVTAFAADRILASGDILEVARQAKTVFDREQWCQILVFDDETSQQIDIDWSGTSDDVLWRIEGRLAYSSVKTRRPGRPKLGVVAREVTLLPRHWEWLSSQPGGASVALRKLVEQARSANQDKDRRRLSQEAAYRFLSATAGNKPGFEEATRALFAGKREAFNQFTSDWPEDIRDYAGRLAAAALAATD